jgi:hypothetical protein
MARNHNGQMALYEVVNRDRFSTAQKKELARVAQAKTEKAVPITIPPQQTKTAEPKKTVWNKKPNMFGFGGGRIETYVPYSVAVTILMGLALLLAITFKIGHFTGKHSVETVAATTEKSSEVTVNLADTAKAAREMARLAAPIKKRAKSSEAIIATAATTTVTSETVATAKTDEYVIVLVELKNVSSARDLDPVKQFFDENGIVTEIKNYRGSYFLVTTEKYDGDFNKGTSGYAAIEKIKQVGAKYKAPAGYGGFGSKPFSDAYGRKM